MHIRYRVDYPSDENQAPDHSLPSVSTYLEAPHHGYSDLSEVPVAPLRSEAAGAIREIYYAEVN